MTTDVKITSHYRVAGYIIELEYDWLQGNISGVLDVIRLLEKFPFVNKVNYSPTNKLIIYTYDQRPLDEMIELLENLFKNDWADPADYYKLHELLPERKNNRVMDSEEIQEMISAITHWFDRENQDILPIFINHHLDNVNFAQIKPESKEQYAKHFYIFQRMGFHEGETLDTAYAEYVERREKENSVCKLNEEQSERWWAFYTVQLGNPMMRPGLGWHYVRYIARMRLAGRM